MTTEQPGVFKFTNDFKIEKKKIKAKSFNIYNQCLLSCFQNPNSTLLDFCTKSCQNDYDQYIQYKRSIKIHEAQNFFYKVDFKPEDKDAQGQSLYYEYPRKVVDMELQFQNYLNNVKIFLQNMEKKYADAAKKK